MGDDTATQVEDQAGDKGGQSGTYTPPATQADMDRIIADRISRERGKYADYDDLKAKAAEHDKAVEAQKSEAQKAVERATVAEAKVAAYEAERQVAAWKADVSKTSGVPAVALAGSTLEEITAHAELLKSLIPAVPERKGAVGPYVPPEGSAPGGAVGGPAEAFGQFLTTQMGR